MKNRLTKKSITISLVAIATVAVALYLRFHHSSTKTTTVSQTKTQATAAGTAAKGSGTAPGSGNEQPTPISGSTTSPTATPTNNTITNSRTATSSNATILPPPTGQLLNVTSASIKNGPGLESICNTVSGATCDIRLTSQDGSVTKYLGSKTANDQGSTDPYEWQANILTAGTWKIAAIASFNGQTAISDSYTLTVTP